MADTELDKILDQVYEEARLDVTNEAYGFILEEAKQKLLKLIDKEVTRNRIDEAFLQTFKAHWTDFCRDKARNMAKTSVLDFLEYIETIQDEGTDNEQATL